jgi:hypothetical protein
LEVVAHADDLIADDYEEAVCFSDDDESEPGEDRDDCEEDIPAHEDSEFKNGEEEEEEEEEKDLQSSVEWDPQWMVEHVNHDQEPQDH